ncbi:hypothetical protein BDZ91DRAFT_778957 [Kalaharituber pfeilii]|nr:hypothetical protein BDZ91DRAFT_778957 [Kalaharituber pfeilii]
MLISLTVGKVDAGIAILLTEDRRLIEFPSILLPPGITSGSIVDIQVSRNTVAEHSSATAFAHLQEEIYNTFGIRSPSKPQLRIRNATQTSVVLEWDPIDLATATLRSLTLYRNGTKSGSIPNPTFTTTKISGLAVNTEYTFHLILKTSAGTYSSDKVTVRTQKLTDLSGITVCPGVMPPEVKEQLEACLQRIGAKPLQDYVRIDTTHFVCTEGRGQAWERAVEMNIPVVRPEWVEACESEGRIVGVRAYYLTADPRLMRPTLRNRAGTTGQQQQPQHTQAPPKNSLDVVATAANTPGATPDMRQSPATIEKKEIPMQPRVEESPEERVQAIDEGTKLETQQTDQVLNTQHEDTEAENGSLQEKDYEKDEPPVSSPSPAQAEAESGDIGGTAAPDQPKEKSEEGFETVPI